MKKTMIAVSVIASIALLTQGFISPKKLITTNHTPTEILQDGKNGLAVYTKVCAACHQATGLGIPGAFPPLAKSDYFNKDVNRAITVVLKGSTGEVVVNGKKFNSVMPAQGNLSDKDIADVLTYAYSSWGNSKKVVTPAMVKALRK